MAGKARANATIHLDRIATQAIELGDLVASDFGGIGRQEGMALTFRMRG